jgi:hypothetical protein
LGTLLKFNVDNRLVVSFNFLLSAFEPVDDELDWTLVYPELATV